MKKYCLHLILSTSLLTQNGYAQNDLLDITSGMDFGGPNLQDSLGSRTKSAAKDAFSETMQDVKTQLSTAYQAVRRGGPSTEEVAEHVINYLQTAIKRDFVTQYFKPDQNNDFNVEALQKLFQPVREKVVNLLRNSLLSEGMVALGPDGAKYPVIRNQELLTVILRNISPDFPLKGALLSLANNKHINALLMKKIDQFILNQFLNVYRLSTGRTLKKDVSHILPSLISGSVKGSVKGVASIPFAAAQLGKNLMADYDDAGELSPLSKDDIAITPEEEQALSKLVQYIEPRLTHVIRDIIQTDYINKIIEKALTASTDPIIKSALRAEPVSKLGNLGAIAGGIASYVNVPLGMTMAGAGYFAGMYLGHFANHMQQQTKGYVLNQLDIYKKYIAYRLLPIKRDEYVLYHLRESPSEDLKNLLQEDYDLRQKITSQSLIWSIIKDVTSVLRLDGVVNTTAAVAQAARDSLTKLKNYFTKRQNTDLVAFSQGIDETFATDKDKKHQAVRKLVSILSQNEKSLSKSDKDFLKDAIRYPSFEVFQKNLENLNKTINYLSTKDLQKLKDEKAINEAKRKETHQKYQEEIRVIHDFVTEIAAYYQHSQHDNMESLDWIEVEEALTHTANMLPVGFLAVLKEMTKDEQFINAHVIQHHNVLDKNYVKEMINAYDKHKHHQEIKDNQVALDLLDTNPISEGLPIPAKLVLVQKGAHAHMQTPNVVELIHQEKVILQGLFNQALAEHIAVELANQMVANKPVIKKLAQQIMSKTKDLDKKSLVTLMQQNVVFNEFRNYVKSLDSSFEVPAEINKTSGGGYIKQSVYNEMWKIMEEVADEVLLEVDFVVIDHPPKDVKSENSVKKSWLWKSKAPSEPQEQAQPLENPQEEPLLSLKFKHPITKMVAYEGCSQETLILAYMVNDRLKKMGGSFDLATQVDAGFMNALYEDIVKRRAFHVLSEDDVLFLEKYRGHILQDAAQNGGNIFYSEYTILQKLREQAKKDQSMALGIPEKKDDIENIIE